MPRKLLFLSVLILFCSTLPAQEFRANIAGHVLDSSGAAVPGVKIQATNTETNEITTATSDTSGAYTILYLRPGPYKVTATAQGFKQFIRDNVTLEAAKSAGIDIRLEVGAVTESVEVTAEAALLETQSATRSGIVDEKQVADMPLNARNPFMLGAMMSGVTFNGAAIWQRPFDNGAIAQWSMNGGRDSSSEFMLDGASNDGQMGSNNVGYVPPVDAVQEFNMMTNIYNAEFGHTGSGIMNVVLKTGTSQHHGSAYEFMRRTALDANTFQNNAIGTPKPTHYLDQYGFEVEGPVFFPKLLKKSSSVKLFYMSTFENYREGTPNPLNVSYPEAEMRTGDFSKLYNASNQPITIYDPLTATYNSDGSIKVDRSAFPGNKIPTNRINPVALAVTKYMPMPNRQAPPGFRYSTSNLSLPDYFDKDKFYNLVLKFDWNFGDKHRAFIRHGSNDRTEDRSDNGIDNKIGTTGQQPFQRINDIYTADWTATVTPTLVTDVRLSFNRFIEKGFGRANEGFDMTSLGLPKSLISTLPSPIYFGRWDFDNYASMGRSQSNNFSNTYQLQGSVTKVLGTHTLKAGFDIRQINYELQNTGNILGFSGSTGWTQKKYNISDSTQGDGYASFLLGIVGGSSNYPLFPWWKQIYAAPYLNDDWKVTPKLTLNLGVRWDFYTPQYEKWGRQLGEFDPNVASPIVSQIPAAMIAKYPQLANLKGGLTYAQGKGLSGSPFPTRMRNIAPRFGLAYQINDKLVLRMGFGQSYMNPPNDWQRTDGFSTSTSLVNSVDGGRTPLDNVLSNPYPNGIVYPVGSSQGAATFVGRGTSYMDRDFLIPSVWQFSFGFQYQASRTSTVEASYVGSRSFNMSMNHSANNYSLAVRKSCDWLEGGKPIVCDATDTNPYKGIAAFAGTSWYTANTISYAQMQRPFPQFSGFNQYGRNDSTMWYDSLQINYNWRMRNGITLLGNYTLSKQMEQWGFKDEYNNVGQQGLYYLDRPQVLKVTVVYDLPFGDGKKIGANANKVVRKLISGWEYTTFFVDPLKGFPNDLPGNAMMLKDPRTPGGKTSDGKPVFDGTTDWKASRPRVWNPCVLKMDTNTGAIAPTSASIGLGCGADFSNNWGNYAWLEVASYAPGYNPSRSGNIRRHHAIQADISLLKNTKITERTRLQLGFEAFNVLNHNYYGRDGFSTSVESANFGSMYPATVSTQNIMPRQIQVRFKFYW